MAENSGIEWTGSTWTPIRARNKATGKVGWHCEHASDGCRFCYSEMQINRRFGTGLPFKPGHRKDIDLFLDEKMLTTPLRWKRGRMIFVCSMTDLFADFVPDEWIDQLFAVMALTPQHTYQVLTKRAFRMNLYVNDTKTPFRVSKAIDALVSALGTEERGEEKISPIDGWPQYFVSDRGRVLTAKGSSTCLHCGNAVEGKIAKAQYCSQKCRQNGQYRLRTGRQPLYLPTLSEMSPDVGEQGHCRVTLYRDGESARELVHRLVLTTFTGPPPNADSQVRHRDGNPQNNAVANLAWGDQSDNWNDRRRHGKHRSYAKLTECDVAAIRQMHSEGHDEDTLGAKFGVSSTQIKNIVNGLQWATSPTIKWPLPNCWKGVSAEDQANYEERWSHLADTPAYVRFVSYEPALAPLSLTQRPGMADSDVNMRAVHPDWVICGGESGAGARMMDLQWARDLRDQCKDYGVAYFFKQTTGKKEIPADLLVRQFPTPRLLEAA